MDIQRSAWHCKISNWNRMEKTNDNLCSYFWRLVSNVCGFIGKGLIILALTLIAGFSCYWIVTDPILLIIVLWMTSSAFLPPFAIYFLRKKLGKSPEMPYGNIFIEYIKARKEKVCPIIKYKD
jgi:hypothetical protein